jgi:hypothetical protein
LRFLFRLCIFIALMATPVVVGATVFLAVAATPYATGMTLPAQSPDRQRCNWACHNETCRHASVLPDVLAGDNGVYGRTIAALAYIGRATGIGYAGANIAVFCVVWPLVTGFIYAVAIGRHVWLR